jgi:hypothetical protein
MMSEIFAVSTKQYFRDAMSYLRTGCDEITIMQAADCKGMSSPRDLIKLACDSKQSRKHFLPSLDRANYWMTDYRFSWYNFRFYRSDIRHVGLCAHSASAAYDPALLPDTAWMRRAQP